MTDIAEPTQWGLNPKQYATRIKLIRAAENRRRAQAALRATPFKLRIIPHVRDTVAPSESKEVFFDGERNRYRVKRGEQIIELAFSAFQHASFPTVHEETAK